MFGIRYLKIAPTSYVLHYRNGRVRRQGAGLSFLYYAPISTIVLIPLGSTDMPFVFNQVTRDFQAVTLQGQLSYRVKDPQKLAVLLDFSVNSAEKYRSEDPQLLGQRLIHLVDIHTGAVTQRMALREVLASGGAIVDEVLQRLRGAELPTTHGVEVLGLSLLSVRPTPEMARALEAESREALQRSADEAIYGRRNAAVEQERRVKESELNTEIAVEEKRRQIRETQMAAEIAVEEQRAALIDRRVDNERKDADGRAYALEATLKPVRDMDWRVLTAVATGNNDPRALIAMAFRELAENAHKIGTLNVTPELLNSLLVARKV